MQSLPFRITLVVYLSALVSTRTTSIQHHQSGIVKPASVVRWVASQGIHFEFEPIKNTSNGDIVASRLVLSEKDYTHFENLARASNMLTTEDFIDTITSTPTLNAKAPEITIEPWYEADCFNTGTIAFRETLNSTIPLMCSSITWYAQTGVQFLKVTGSGGETFESADKEKMEVWITYTTKWPTRITPDGECERQTMRLLQLCTTGDRQVVDLK
ncbi:hypothetical protein CC78DRAFT_539971 [Lojkania enalia]|uniref:Uncharacterized protein n=1 Tax=Lojkania enalia TaxID=147567 RepID=A0A9P4TQC0_9PLEO|nr:hypothetical protein CC78DRAFT_539971 [Didymosphaeria enalia]